MDTPQICIEIDIEICVVFNRINEMKILTKTKTSDCSETEQSEEESPDTRHLSSKSGIGFQQILV